jgi:hypothetical protein
MRPDGVITLLGKRYYFDYTNCGGACPHQVKNSNSDLNAVTNTRECEKRRKYQEASEASGGEFVPLVATSQGALSRITLEFCKLIAESSRHPSDSKEKVADELRRAITRAQADALLNGETEVFHVARLPIELASIPSEPPINAPVPSLICIEGDDQDELPPATARVLDLDTTSLLLDSENHNHNHAAQPTRTSQPHRGWRQMLNALTPSQFLRLGSNSSRNQNMHMTADANQNDANEGQWAQSSPSGE